MSTPAKDKAERLEFPTSQRESEFLLSLTSEGVEMLEKNNFTFLSSIQDMNIGLKRLSKSTCLSGEEIYSFSRLISVTGRTISFFSTSFGKKFKNWAKKLDCLINISFLQKTIQKAIDTDGTVLPTASQKLTKLRKEEVKIHEFIKKEIKQILKKLKAKGFVQDDFYDLRDKRYVIPVKKTHRRDVPGLSYEKSGSRATVYLEPEELKKYNDKIQQIQIDIEEEIYRILRELTDFLFPHHFEFEKNYHSLVNFDLGLAKSRMSKGYNEYKYANPFSFSKKIELTGLYHPLLKNILKSEELIGSDFFLSKDNNTVIISGPNTGGKTVFLKALGINALMAKAGFWIMCRNHACIPYFNQVLAHTENKQSIEESLSSFSSSILLIKEIIEKTDPNTLILIDEILSSTDPSESSALSGAILEKLSAKGATTIVSTHFGELKNISNNNNSFINASMEFDVKKMEPLFRLRLGIPGRSWALETAKRIGLDKNIILDARSKLHKNYIKMDELLSKIELKEIELTEIKDALFKKEHLLEKKIKEIDTIKSTVILEKNKLKETFLLKFNKAKKDMNQELSKVMDKYKEMIKDFPRLQESFKKDKMATKQKIETDIPEILKEETKKRSIPISKGAREEKLKPGHEIFVNSIQKNAILQNSPLSKKKKDKLAIIEVSGMRLSVPWEDIISIKKESKISERRKYFKGSKLSSDANDLPAEINVIGMRAEEALHTLDIFLDKSVQSTREKVKIIHGHGSGILKKVIRKHLKNNPYGFSFYAATEEEGGDACTIVSLQKTK